MTKIRVRNARYPDAHHIETLIQSAIEDGGPVTLPPIERPHILNYLNFHISRGEVIVAVGDGKLLGFVLVELGNFPWSTQFGVFVTALFVVPKLHRHDGVGEALIAELISQATRGGNAIVFRPMVGLDGGMTDEMLAASNLTKSHGCYCFQPVAKVENPEE